MSCEFSPADGGPCVCHGAETDQCARCEDAARCEVWLPGEVEHLCEGCADALSKEGKVLGVRFLEDAIG